MPTDRRASDALVYAERLKADIRLAQAIKDFEKDLSDEQKTEFRCPPTPDSVDVMRFTAQFDQALSSEGIQRGFGPRLTCFLESVQQFATIGDILVGGSQCLPASGIWALVRFSLLAMVRIPSSIEKLSYLFMEIGQFTPRYANLQSLFPQSKQLQVFLIEYHTVVVQLCHKILRLSKERVLLQFLSSFYDLAKKHRLELEHWATAIANEVAIQTAKLVKHESQSNRKTRKLTKRFFIRHEQADTESFRARLLDLCCTYDYQKAWKQIRKLGNTTLFTLSSEYMEWRDKMESGCLIYTGILGCGKSVLLANIVDDLHIAIHKQNTIVAYFFCQFNKPESLMAQTILGSLAHQILIAGALDDDHLELLRSRFPPGTMSLDLDAICDIIRLVSKTKRGLVFVIDGLDECDTTTKEDVVARIKELLGSDSLRVCISSRLEPDVKSKPWLEQLKDTRFVSMPKVNNDIQDWLRLELRMLVETRKLVLSDQSVLNEIQDVLTIESKGMFLWTALQLSSLCLMESDNAIRKALYDLPRTLSETYRRLMSACNLVGSPNPVRIFGLVMVALRPLTMAELGELLSIEPGDIEYDPSNAINDIMRILTTCRGLVTVDEEDLAVELVHSSFKTFLLIPGSEIVNLQECRLDMAKRILTYANYSIFETQLSRHGSAQLEIASVPGDVVRSTLSSSILKGLVSRPRRSTHIDITTLQSRRNPQNDVQSLYPFLLYMQSYWCDHLYTIDLDDQTLVELLERALKRHRLDIAGERGTQTPLVRTAKTNCHTLFAVLLANASFSTYDRSFALWNAVEYRQDKILGMMANSKQFDTNWRDGHGLTPLHKSALDDSSTIAETLLDLDSSLLNEKNMMGETSLMLAAKQDSTKVIELLLCRDEVAVNAVSNGTGESALMYAAKEGHTRSLKLLLANPKIDAYAKTAMGLHPLKVWDRDTALSIAARHSQYDIAEILLGENFEVSVTDIDFALDHASGEAVTQLLRKGSKTTREKTGWFVCKAVIGTDVQKLNTVLDTNLPNL